jgi:hypothetical protein
MAAMMVGKWSAGSSDITFKGNPLRMIQAKFGLNWPSDFRGEKFWKSLQTDDGRQVSANQKQESPVAAMFVTDRDGLRNLYRGPSRCFLPSFRSFGQAVSEEKIFRNRPIRNKNCLWRLYL